MGEHSIFMHEIKNCLSNIYSLVEIIETDPTESKQCMKLIKDSVKQIKNIQTDYDILRKSGKTQINLTHVNLPSVVLSVINQCRGAVEEQDINLNLDIAFDCQNLKITTDTTKLQQVLINLLTNACKYNTPKGKIDIQVYKKEKIHIRISDTGIGITPEEIKCLGVLFFRGKRNTAEGTGLGWPLIKQICATMGWEIIVKSQKSKFEYSTVIDLIL